MFPKLARKRGAFAYISSILGRLVIIREICLIINQYQTCGKLVKIDKRLFIKVFSQSLDLVLESF